MRRFTGLEGLSQVVFFNEIQISVEADRLVVTRRGRLGMQFCFEVKWQITCVFCIINLLIICFKKVFAVLSFLFLARTSHWEDVARSRYEV